MPIKIKLKAFSKLNAIISNERKHFRLISLLAFGIEFDFGLDFWLVSRYMLLGFNFMQCKM